MRSGALATAATIALHAAALAALSAAHADAPRTARPPPLEWLELAPEPLPELAPEPRHTPDPEPSRAEAPAPAEPPPVAPPPRPRRAAPARVVTALPSALASPSAPVVATADAPDDFVDFSTTPLVERVLGGAPASEASAGSAGTAAAAPITAPAPAVAPALVPAGDLSRPPAPPDLRDALRRSYPAATRERGEEGSALVVMRIGPGGEVLRPRIVETSAPELGEACVAVLRGSRWSEPLDREGRRVTTLVRYRCEFRIR